MKAIYVNLNVDNINNFNVVEIREALMDYSKSAMRPTRGQKILIQRFQELQTFIDYVKANGEMINYKYHVLLTPAQIQFGYIVTEKLMDVLSTAMSERAWQRWVTALNEQLLPVWDTISQLVDDSNQLINTGQLSNGMPDF